MLASTIEETLADDDFAISSPVLDSIDTIALPGSSSFDIVDVSVLLYSLTIF